MNRQLRVNLILLATVALLGALIWFAQPAGFPPLTPLDPFTVELIEISDLSGRQIRLQRDARGWRSGSATANHPRIAQLLGICRTASLDRFPTPADLSPFGLDPAPIRLRLDGLIIDFGTTDPINGWRYVRVGNQIHLIADGFYHHLTAAPGEWLESP
jgi:hypothetical protein